jgi:phosphorylcholine metabolism protein LicD
MIGSGGHKQPATLLNKTLHYIITLLEKYKLKDWFLGYGTLLGIVRNNSCIKNDDDIDIIMNHNYLDILYQIAKENKFKMIENPHFLRFESKEYTPIDFYLATFKDDMAIDKWENTKWTNIFPLIQKKWKGVILQLPNQYIKNLKNRYGYSWRTPKQSKGKQSKTMKKPLVI